MSVFLGKRLLFVGVATVMCFADWDVCAGPPLAENEKTPDQSENRSNNAQSAKTEEASNATAEEGCQVIERIDSKQSEGAPESSAPLPRHYVHNPSWWTTRKIIVEGAKPNHRGPANIGQLKNITRGAILEMEEHLPGGAGCELLALLDSWDAKPKQASHLSPCNQGQLKNVASKVYDRLIAEGLADSYPWTLSTSDDSHHSMVLLGQLKFVYSFEIRPGVLGVLR